MMRRLRFPLLLALAALLAPSGCEEALVEAPPPPPGPCDGPPCAINALVRAYQTKDLALLGSLLANDAASNAEFLFLLDAPPEGGEPSWSRDEMLRIHVRLFHPESPPPGDDPLPPEAWLQSLSVTLTQRESFAERADLYSSDGSEDGKLDPARWRAADATYGVRVFVDLQGETDFLVDAAANFVVIDDLTKGVDDPGKLLLYIWEDICPKSPAAVPQSVERACLGPLLAVYR